MILDLRIMILRNYDLANYDPGLANDDPDLANYDLVEL